MNWFLNTPRYNLFIDNMEEFFMNNDPEICYECDGRGWTDGDKCTFCEGFGVVALPTDIKKRAIRLADAIMESIQMRDQFEYDLIALAHRKDLQMEDIGIEFIALMTQFIADRDELKSIAHSNMKR